MPSLMPSGSPAIATCSRLAWSAALTWAGVRFGLVESNSPAAPATCGLAIEVPG
jgi:hypothetical protein